MHQLQNWDKPINCSYLNSEFIDTRTCAFNPDQYQDLRLKNLNFTRCGYSITPVPFDFEDGWQNSVDTYISNCNIVENLSVQCRGGLFYVQNIESRFFIYSFLIISICCWFQHTPC